MSIQHSAAWSLISGVLLLATPLSAADAVTIQSDLVYGTVGETKLSMDIAYPNKSLAPMPCIVVIHGGAWMHGNKSMHTDDIKYFAKQGYVSASVGYRLAPSHRFPAQVEDVKCAIRYLRANCEKFNLDPNQIGAVGYSAGAHLSMMLGTMDKEDGLEGDGGWPDESSKIQAVVSYFGPTQLDANDIPTNSVPLVSTFIGGSPTEKPESYRQASPLTYVSPEDAPMLLFQGTSDPLVPYSQAIKMVTAMSRHKVPGRVELLINADHGGNWGIEEFERTKDATSAFFDKHLKNQ
ncbi:MAG TPA: alpha/beta hydrolase [Rhodopirellula sp.]|nr:alpha/beta hydrolase [Rhodopirellula sp.]